MHVMTLGVFKQGIRGKLIAANADRPTLYMGNEHACHALPPCLCCDVNTFKKNYRR